MGAVSILAHTTPDATSTCGPGGVFMAAARTGFGTTNANLFLSTLSGTATPELHGTLVECFGPDFSRDVSNRVGDIILHVLGQ